MINLIALAIPFFFILIGIEYVASKQLNKPVYRLNDSITDLNCGIGSEMIDIVVKIASVGLYYYVLTHWSFFQLSKDQILVWIACYFLVDFCYYWAHRCMHEIACMWAAHIVHHSSEDYNLAVALRQSWFQGIFSMFFYLPVALMGFPVVIYATCRALNTLYQFWIHTQLIDKMGFMEKLFLTPSHHRVHHGKNPQYINKNYGSTLILWDKLFGSFEPEVDKVYFGVTHPPKSFNPFKANFHYWTRLFNIAKQSKHKLSLLTIWFHSPGWCPKDLRELPSTPPVELTYKYEKKTSPQIKRYVFLHFVLLALGVTSILMFEEAFTPVLLIVSVALVFLTIQSFGNILDGKASAYSYEQFRLILLSVLVIYLFSSFYSALSLSLLFLLVMGYSMVYFHQSWKALNPIT